MFCVQLYGCLYIKIVPSANQHRHNMLTYVKQENNWMKYHKNNAVIFLLDKIHN